MLNEIRQERDKKRDQKTLVSSKIDDAKKSKRISEDELENAVKLVKKHQIAQKRLSMSWRIRDELENLYQKYESTEIDKINAHVKDIFDSIIHKENVFKEFSLMASISLMYREATIMTIY